MVLISFSGATGWAGWAYLRQALKLMHHLEFDKDVKPDDIKSALAGSSIASASSLLLKVLCFIATFASSSILIGVIYFYLFLKAQNIEPSVSHYMLASTLIALPYFLILINPRVKYFQPSNWDSASWIFRLFLKSFIEESSLSKPSIDYETLPAQVSRQKADKIIGDIVEYLPQAYSATFNTLGRKYGFGLIKRWANIEALLEDEYEKIVEKKVSEIIHREFPGSDPDEQAAIIYYFMFLERC